MSNQTLETSRRVQRMKETLPMESLTAKSWSRLSSFVDRCGKEIEQSGSLEEAFQNICELNGGRPKNRKWQAGVWVMMEARGLRCAGYRIDVVGNDRVRLDLDDFESRYLEESTR